MQTEVNFQADEVDVSLTYDAAADSIRVTANHSEIAPDPNDLICVTKVDKHGRSNSEPPSYYFSQGNFSQGYTAHLHDRFGIELHLPSGIINRAVDITKSGLRLN